MAALPLSLRFAWRELRGGVRGVRLFLACLALGVAAIAAVGSVSAALVAGLAADARALLGGDIEVSLVQRQASLEELTWLERQGRLSSTTEMRAMAQNPAGERTLIELKGVDEAYPLMGAVETEPNSSLASLLAAADGGWGAAIEPALQSRLHLTVGDRLKIGEAVYRVSAILRREPDRATGFFDFGPQVLVAAASLPSTELMRPGSLIRHHYRLELPAGIAPPAFKATIEGTFPTAGWRVRSYDEAAPGLRQFIERITQYLSLVGLTALLVGGVGVGNAVKSHLEAKLATIATFKCLGATVGTVFRLYFALIMGMALVGVLIGTALGALAPWAARGLLASVLPVNADLGLHWEPLLLAGACGLLTTLAFTLWPLARAASVMPAGLFRAVVSPPDRLPRWGYLAASAAAAIVLALLILWRSLDRPLALYFIAGAIGAVILFRGAAWGLMTLARRFGHQRRPMLRLALANLHRPGAPTGAIALSLGLGLTVLVAVALIEANLARQIHERLPERAPTFFFIDIQPDQVAAFDRLVAATPGASGLQRTPMVRGRIARIAGITADRAPVKPNASWAVAGDRGFSYAATPPPGAKIAEGTWWPPDYQGPPLISVDDGIAKGFGVGVGDTITLNILGREIEARIANTRSIDWGSLGMNFTFIFAPGTLEGAPQTHIATVHAASETAETELLNAVGDRFPNVSAIRVKDALDAAARILESIAIAIRLTAAVTLLAGALVLAGAVMAGQHARIHDAVVLKVLGARRREVVTAFLLEYGCLGLIAALIASVLGTVVGYLVLTRLMRSDFVFAPNAVASSTLVALAITLALGLAGTWHALGQKAAPMLRND
ncbi:MAG: ABC transporter permease [Proteobacteria bacterium]|nr:ABC transporter permease [Pseudomonadota bacterium]MBI3499250.1 ABC transporter permease [Pseudomonadota bacterium]